MKYFLLAIFCSLGLSASAQWWHININFKKHDVLPLIRPVKDHSMARIKTIAPKLNTPQLAVIDLGQSQLTLQSTEAAMLKIAKHNMRFRVYHEASYNFSDLAQLYVQMHRLSEAKWYFLQSNNISREENDDKHTISNLVSLALVKTDIGDVSSAHADLVEARDLAHARGMQAQFEDISKKLLYLDQYKVPAIRPELKYAESAETGKKMWQ